jgi:predicted enzyme related to lactoylglutathione lyase
MTSTINHNVVGWFEIPVNDMDRAMQFYETVFGFKLSRNQMGPLDMAWFPWVDNGMGAGGSLVYHPDQYKPSSDGTLVYLTAWSGDVAVELSRIEAAGGKVLMEKKEISPEHGFMALFLDTEGNRIALHSRG